MNGTDPAAELDALRRYAIGYGTAVYIAARKAGDEEAAAQVLAEMASVGLKPDIPPPPAPRASS